MSVGLQNVRMGEGSMAFMMHISACISLTSYAFEHGGKPRRILSDAWDDFRGGFWDHLKIKHTRKNLL